MACVASKLKRDENKMRLRRRVDESVTFAFDDLTNCARRHDEVIVSENKRD